MQMQRSRIAGVLLAVSTGAATALVPVAAPAQAAGVDCYAHMNASAAYPNAHGGARYESHTDWREFEIHVAGIKKLAGKRLVVRAHGALVGRMRVSPYGRAHLYRHSDVPSMQSGDRIRVRTKSGTLVTSGTLRNMHHHMM
jgi:hypothetical protein